MITHTVSLSGNHKFDPRISLDGPMQKLPKTTKCSPERPSSEVAQIQGQEVVAVVNEQVQF